MNKENGIKRLNRLSVKAKEYRDENTQVVKLSQAIEVIELIDQVGEPERVVVPQFVAKYIEIQREYGHENIRIAIKRIEGRGEHSRLFNWFFFENNSDLFAKAWIYGYEVEKEPLFHMPVPYLEDAYYRNDDLKELTSFKKDSKFTQTELDERFPDIKHMAVEVKDES